jgi:hypothetical protein
VREQRVASRLIFEVVLLKAAFCTFCCCAVPPELLSQQTKADSAVAGPEAEASKASLAGDTENRDAASTLQQVSAAAAGCTAQVYS